MTKNLNLSCWKLILALALFQPILFFDQIKFCNSSTSSSSGSNSSRNKTPIKKSTYIIGDLHGDVKCARYWVDQTGLVVPVPPSSASVDDELYTNGTGTSTEGRRRRWADPTSVLVFMGDYVDKGPTSRQTLEFVKELTEEFPHNVIALLGNHEMELLLDASEASTRWNGYAYHNLAYASIHPSEYLNYLHPSDRRHKDDTLVIDALYNAALKLYGAANPQLYYSIFMTPLPDVNVTVENARSSRSAISSSIISHIQPESIRPLVAQRLKLYQQRYMEHFQRHTPLGNWLRSRPILHLTHDGTLLVHGGIPINLAKVLLSKGLPDIKEINRQWVEEEYDQDNLYSFITETDIGQAIYTMVTYRGNHYYSTCRQFQQLFNSMEGVVRLGVGHTPSSTVRIRCNGTFLALDSTLGRWIRASGNEYCRGDSTYTYGNFVCPKINDDCQGQIVRIGSDDHSIEILRDDKHEYQKQQQTTATMEAIDEL